MILNIINFEKHFYFKTLELIFDLIEKNNIILLSGGNTIKKILIKNKKKININNHKTIILSDERIYNNINDVRTNYTNLNKNLLSFCNPKKIKFIHFPLGVKHQKLSEVFYKKIKSHIPKVAILSLGTDGHICSIFNNEENIRYNEYLNIVKHKNKINRISVNEDFIYKIKMIYLIVCGEKKGLILKKIIEGKKTNFPLKNFKNITFILDKNALSRINN